MASRDTLQEVIRERNALRLKLWAEDAFAHRWLCHSDGSECEDGCNREAKPSRLAVYTTDIEQAT